MKSRVGLSLAADSTRGMFKKSSRGFKVAIAGKTARGLNEAEDYPPLLEENRIQERKRVNEPNGMLVPAGNPYHVSMNSEVMLVQNKKAELANKIEKMIQQTSISPRSRASGLDGPTARFQPETFRTMDSSKIKDYHRDQHSTDNSLMNVKTSKNSHGQLNKDLVESKLASSSYKPFVSIDPQTGFSRSPRENSPDEFD